jgi:hypothetical protein
MTKKHAESESKGFCAKKYHEYKTVLYRLVFHAPKPIKLGSKGSSTKRWGTVKDFKKLKKPKKNPFFFIFNIFENIT